MTDESEASAIEQLSELKTTVAEGVKAAASSLREAIEDGKKPGKPLDVLSRITREAPLGALLVAFLVGRFVARRRW